MENTDLPNESSQSAPAMPSAPRRSGWRIAAGILVSIFTLLVTAVLVFMSICFGLVFKAPYSGDKAWIYGLFLVTILVPIGGTWLAVRLFRGAKKAGTAAALEAGVPAAAPRPLLPAKEIEERLAYLRLAILVAILAHAALLVLSFSRYRSATTGLGAAYTGWMVPMIVSFILYQIPYVVVLLGIRNRGERWALSLALMFPILSLCFSAFSLLFMFSRYTGMGVAANPIIYLLGPALSVILIVFAWRAWRAEGPTGDDAVQLVVSGMASGVYLFLIELFRPLLYRLIHF